MNKLLLILMLSVAALPLAAQEADPKDEAFTEIRNIVDALHRLKVSGYLQGQYVGDERANDAFSVRRARVKFTYQATPTSRFVLQPDISSSGVTLKDGYAGDLKKFLEWALGPQGQRIVTEVGYFPVK